jgi:xanthine dehydrogenase accessory factor
MQGDISPLELSRTISTLLAGGLGGRGALATVIERSGSAPQITGAKLLMLDDGTHLGTVGGGAIEAKVLEACRQTLRFGRARKVRHDLVKDLAMCCGGSMEIFVEYLEAQQRLFIIGAGHVSQALAPLARELAFDVHVLDDRDELLEHPAFESLRTGSYDADELDSALGEASERDCFVIVTRDHARDERALASLLERPHAYLGMIGSRRKVHTVLGRVLRRYEERGRDRPSLDRLRAPIGLNLGGRTPKEIAVSIVAELVAERHGGDGSQMSITEQVLATRSSSPSSDPEAESA